MSLYSTVTKRNWDESHIPNANCDGFTLALLTLAHAWDVSWDEPTGVNAVDAVADRIATVLGEDFRHVTDRVRSILSTVRESMARENG
jgi:hypothetical protein